MVVLHHPAVVGAAAEGGVGRGKQAFTVIEKKPILEATMRQGPVYARSVGARQFAPGIRGWRAVVWELREQADGKLVAEVCELGPLETLADASHRGEAMLRQALRPKPVRLNHG